MTSIIKGLYI